MSEDRCDRCDREDCPTFGGYVEIGRGAAEEEAAKQADCEAHRVDWRARTLAAEQRVERAEAALYPYSFNTSSGLWECVSCGEGRRYGKTPNHEESCPHFSGSERARAEQAEASLKVVLSARDALAKPQTVIASTRSGASPTGAHRSTCRAGPRASPWR